MINLKHHQGGFLPKGIDLICEPPNCVYYLHICEKNKNELIRYIEEDKKTAKIIGKYRRFKR